MLKLTLAALFALFCCSPLLSFAQGTAILKKSVAITEFKNVTAAQPGAAGGAQSGSQGNDPNAQPPQGGGGQPGQAGDPNQQQQPADPNAQPAQGGGGDPNAGQGQGAGGSADYSTLLTTMLTTELVKTNAFIVSEGVVQPNETVQLMVTGSIMKWEGGAPKAKLGDFKSYKTHNTSTVTVELRILDGSTGQIISAQTATSTINQKNLFNNKADHTLDTAEHRVVAQCVDFIKAAAQKVAWQGSVVQLTSDGAVFIKPGSNGGVAIGMVFDVYRVGPEIKDASGESLGNDMKKIGSITVTGDIGNGKAAKASVTSGNGIKAGDVLKPQ